MPPDRRSVSGALLALLLGCGGASAQALDQTVVVRAWFDDEASIRAVAPLLGHAQIDRAKGVLRTEVDGALRQALLDAGFRIEIDADATRAVQGLAQAERAGMKSIPGFACYRTVEETQATLDTLVAAAPGLVEIVDIGPSWQAQTGSGGYRLQVIRATNRSLPGPKPKVFVMASVHAREYTPAEFATRFVEQLVAGYGVDAEATWLLDHHELHALLQANPDGRKRAETGLSWRKNANTGFCGGGNSAGIDLNRNFPFEWGNWNGSSGAACDSTFRGPAPASEPETQAIIAYVRSQFEDRRSTPLNAPADPDTTGMFFDLHSFSGLVLWPWGFDTVNAPNSAALQALGRRLAWFNGYTPQAAVGLYPTDGSTDDFAYGELGLPAYTFELGSAFFQDCASFESAIYPDNRDALRYALRAARAPYRQPSGPDAYALTVEPDLAVIGEPITLRATLDDQRQREGSFDQSGPLPPVQAVSVATAHVGTPPWQAEAQGLPLQPVDGAFNSSVERAVATIDSTGLGAGRHLLWVQGRDAAGNDGPPAATFIDLLAAPDILTVQGAVRQFGTASPLAASVASGTYRSQANPLTGDYQRRLPAGSHDIAYSAEGHETLVLTAVSGQGGQTLQRDVALYRLCSLLADPVEVGTTSPLTAQPPWTRRAGRGIDGGGAWLPTAGASYAGNLSVSLTSAILDLGGYALPELIFDQRCDTEAGYDYGRVEISSSGGTNWTEVFRCDGETSWRRVTLTLPQLAGQGNSRLRFRFSSDSMVSAPGWAIDNIQLRAGGQQCRDSQGPPRLEPFRNGFEAQAK